MKSVNGFERRNSEDHAPVKSGTARDRADTVRGRARSRTSPPDALRAAARRLHARDELDAGGEELGGEVAEPSGPAALRQRARSRLEAVRGSAAAADDLPDAADDLAESATAAMAPGLADRGPGRGGAGRGGASTGANASRKRARHERESDPELSGDSEDGLDDSAPVPEPYADSDKEEDGMDSFLDAGGAEPNAREEVRGWDVLREQVKADLHSAKKRKLTLTQVNQLLIIRNFATLRLKGFGRIAASQEIARQWHEGEGVHFARQVRALARHYQLFEQLPVEKRGGDRGRSLFNDERVQVASRTYLSSLSSGEVTPKQFVRALNQQILPSLGYRLKKDLSVRTARRWLVKLGWRHVRTRKGVYMDGHERDDVVKYRKEVFLPLMEKYEKFMVQWMLVDSVLTRVEPKLGPGEKRIVPIFQDESSFHANEYKQTVW